MSERRGVLQIYPGKTLNFRSPKLKKIKPTNHRSLNFFATFSSLWSNGAKMSHYKPRASQINLTTRADLGLSRTTSALTLVTNCKFTTFLSVTNPLILPAPPEIFIVAERTRSDLEISWTHSGVTTSNTRNKPKSPQKSIKSAFRIIKVTRVHNLHMKMVDFASFTICTWKEASCLREYFAKTISLLYFHQNCQIAEISDYFVNWLLVN